MCVTERDGYLGPTDRQVPIFGLKGLAPDVTDVHKPISAEMTFHTTKGENVGLAGKQVLNGSFKLHGGQIKFIVYEAKNLDANHRV